MRAPAAPRVLAVFLGLCVITGAAAPAAAQLFEWTDAQGVVHYTADRESIPAAHRDGARVLSPPQPRPGGAAAPGPPADDPTVMPYAAGGPLVIAARLNGVPLSLLVDTGADRTVIAPAAIARAGFGAERGQPVQIVGVAGEGTATLITVPHLDLAGARVGPVAVVVHDVPTPGIDGLLGRDVLDAFSLTVDAGSGRARLVPR